MEGKDGAYDAFDAGAELQSYCPPELLQTVTELAPVLYRDLKRIAHRERVRLFSPNTMTTTSLVHECYLKLQGKPGFATPQDVLRVGAVTMRHVLIDRVRAQQAAKRGGGAEHVELDETTEGADLTIEDGDTVLGVHEALQRLARASPRAAQVVQCRFFGGYSDPEIATALDITERTVRRDWVFGRAFLTRELGVDAGRALGPPAA